METPTTKAEAIDASVRVSFATREAFAAHEAALLATAAARPHTSARSIARQTVNNRASRDESINFRTLSRGSDAAALKAVAARTNDAVRTLYSAPSDHRFRVASPSTSWLAGSDADFVAKFTVPSNQDVRRRTAIDQDGFFGPANGEDLQPVSIRFQQTLDQQQCRSCVSPSPRTPSQPDFASRVAHTARKSANVELRRETIVDQSGLLPALETIRCHSFRNETPPVTPFDTSFKPRAPYKPLAGDAVTTQRQLTSQGLGRSDTQR